MDYTEKEYVYVPKSLAEKVKQVQSVEQEQEIVQELIKNKRLHIESELNQLEEDLARFKAACIVHKCEMKKVYDEQNSLIDDMIDTVWDCMPKAKEAAKRLAQEVQPLAKEVRETHQLIDDLKVATSNVNFYGIERIIDVAEKVERMDQTTREIMMFLISNYKNTD